MLKELKEDMEKLQKSPYEQDGNITKEIKDLKKNKPQNKKNIWNLKVQ